MEMCSPTGRTSFDDCPPGLARPAIGGPMTDRCVHWSTRVLVGRRRCVVRQAEGSVRWCHRRVAESSRAGCGPGPARRLGQDAATSSRAAPRPSTIDVDLLAGDRERRRDLERVAAQDARRDAVAERRADDPGRDAGSAASRSGVDGDGRGQPDGPDLADEGQRSPGGGWPRRTAPPCSATRATRPSPSMMSRLAIAAAQAAAWPRVRVAVEEHRAGRRAVPERRRHARRRRARRRAAGSREVTTLAKVTMSGSMP